MANDPLKIHMLQGDRSDLPLNRDPGQLLFATYDDVLFTKDQPSGILMKQGDIYLDMGEGPNGVRVNLANDVDKARTLFAGQTSTNDTEGVWTTTIDGITVLYDGLTIVLRLNTSYNNTFNSLNVNGLGPKLVWYRKNSRLTTHVPNGAELLLVYRTNAGSYQIPATSTRTDITANTICTDGWILATSYADGNTIPSAYCSTGASTTAKAASCSGYAATANQYIHIIFSNTNTANVPTLNINSTGAKPIYLNGQPVSSSNKNIVKGSYIAYYDGTNYYLRNDGILPGQIEKALAADAATVATFADEADKLSTPHTLKVNLSSTLASTGFDGTADINDIGVDGVLSPSYGGTGEITLNAAANSLINSLTTGSSEPKMTDYFISQYVNGGTTTTSYHRRPIQKLYDLFSSTMSNSGNSFTATKLTTPRELSVSLGRVRAANTTSTFDGSADVMNITVSGVLGVGCGGTGMSSNPSMLIDLASSTAATIFQSSPTPGVTGILPVSHGGTGVDQISNIQAGKDADGNVITATYATKDELNNLIGAADALVFKGVLTDTVGLPNTHKQGWVYKVGYATQFAGQNCEIGDMVICVADGTTANNNDWVVLQNNLDGAVTSSQLQSSNNSNALVVFDGNTGRIIKRSGGAGSATLPIYIDSNGALQTITSYQGNAATANKLAAGKTIAISGAVTGTATTFDGSGNITIPTTAIDISKVNSGILPIGYGGTGSTSAAGAIGNLVGASAIGGSAKPIYYAGNGVFSAIGTGSKIGDTNQSIYVAADGTLTAGLLYAGGTAVTLNGVSKGATTAGFYAPTGGGTAGYVLIAKGNNTEPIWASDIQIANSKVTIGSATEFSMGITANSTNDSTYSTYTSASLVVKGGLSVAKNASVKSLRIDNNQTSKGVSLQYDATNEVLNFVFA